ncbi:GNAT family N-acetyltransferase [Dactylosporangium matsuzakiense]|uniref:N-acetyltransferase n=1 Tax=Dactylosporangium matsuzakiense TaxID=53360 RepID=A0A9W6KT95_9ACTN|nr:GNAT family N-acetyltransferase [Dactylosporangium matsuzakiense]GLL07223.1 N-acetyltransferase [Dactylosporangium matsuzakiense]
MSTPQIRPRIRIGVDADVAPVARLIAESFAPIDLSRWLVPSDDDRVGVLARYFTIHVEHALWHGQVDIIDHTQVPAGIDGAAGPAAVAVWFAVPHPHIPCYSERQRTVCGPWTDRFERLEAQMHHAHPHQQDPHMYGAFMAVDARLHNQGLGSVLLDQRLTDMDQYGLPAYLEAGNARSRNLYLRKGFTDCAPVFDLPYDGEPLYPMWRPGRHDPGRTGAEPQAPADQQPR